MKYIVDSDFLFGLYVKSDSHHKETVTRLKKIIKEKVKLVVINLVIQETATVLSKKSDQQTALLFLREVFKMPLGVMKLNDNDEKDSWEIFKKQTKKSTSFIDCANLAICEKYDFDGILSFDDFYPKEVRVT